MPDNSNRNTILFVIASLVLLFGYQALVLGPQNKQREAELKARETAQAAQAPGTGAPVAPATGPVFVSREAAIAGAPSAHGSRRYSASPCTGRPNTDCPGSAPT